MRASLLIVFAAAVWLAACSGAGTAGAATRGIEGNWSAPVQPNGTLIVELHRASGCPNNGECALTGTFTDNRNGNRGELVNSHISGNTVHIEAVIGPEAAHSTAKCDTTLEQSQLAMTGTCVIQGIYSNVPQSFK